MTQDMIWTGVLVFLATAALGYIGLPVLRHLNVGQKVRSFGPKTHLKKDGTPTFGGFLFIIPIAVAGIVLAIRKPGAGILPILLLSLAMAVIGFVDDYVKVRINKKGLSEKQKSLAILVVVLAFGIWYLYLNPTAPFFLVPFTGQRILVTGVWKLFYLAFVMFYLYACTNAVNLTDGVDGLCVSVTGVVAIFTMLTALRLGEHFASEGLATLYEGQTLLSVMLLAGCLGFFVHNRHVARVFMGDTGSLMLGAMVSGIMLMQGFPWAFVIAGIIYVAEIGSVFIQRTYFRRSGGKRIFKMSPIHHHFELSGWSEWKIVGVFGLITLVASALAFLIIRA